MPCRPPGSLFMGAPLGLAGVGAASVSEAGRPPNDSPAAVGLRLFLRRSVAGLALAVKARGLFRASIHQAACAADSHCVGGLGWVHDKGRLFLN